MNLIFKKLGGIMKTKRKKNKSSPPKKLNWKKKYVINLSIVEALDLPEVGLSVEDYPVVGPVLRLVVEQVLQVGDARCRVKVDEA